jgi:DNA-binding IclR family transcriptional regulator
MMIQVLERTFLILKLISKKHDGASLIELTKSSGLNKTTLFNILKSLKELGAVSQDESGLYHFGDSLYSLMKESLKKNTLSGISKDYAEGLAAATRESCLISYFIDGKIIILARGFSDHTIIVNRKINKLLSIKSTASGMVILANLPEHERKKYITLNDFKNTDGFENIKTISDLSKKFEEIRNNGFYIKLIEERHAHALAVPFFDSEENVAGTVAMTVPDLRFDSRQRKYLLLKMQEVAERLKIILTCTTSPLSKITETYKP